jgi:hypothetical protein
LFSFPFIFPKTSFVVDLPIFYILGTTWEEWEKRKCKGWNGRKGPTFILGGPTKLFPNIVTLFAKHGIGSWILIWVTHWTFSLNFKNALLSKCGIGLLMLFPLSFSLNITSIQWANKKCRWIPEDVFYFHPSIPHGQH